MTDATTKKKPFGFEVSYELFDARGERLREVLLIENPGSGQALQLSIVNALVQEQETITLHPISQVTSNKYHLRLRFPANTLVLRETSAVGTDWAVLRVRNADGTTDVFLAWRSSLDVTLAPGESLIVALQGVSALPTVVGAKVQMELMWPSPDTAPVDTSVLTILTPAGPGQPGDYEVEAQRLLNVRNRQGKPDCPLRAGFVGDNGVLNVPGAEEGTLRLRLSNDAPQGSENNTLRFVYDTNSPTRTSQLVVALPVGTVEDAPWALGTEQQVKAITFSTLPDWDRSAGKLSEDKAFWEWTFTPTKEVTLAPREFLELQLGKLVTLHPTGPTQLVVRYSAVPGYWDGERVCTLEKAPLIFGHKVDASHDYSGHVGIGNPTPTARLYLRGGPLRLHNAEVQNEGQLIFRSDADKTGDATSVQFFKKDETTALMTLSSGGDLSFTGSLSSKGSLNADGNLAIKGNATADGDLTIKGRAKDKSGWLVPVGTIVAYAGSNAPEGWMLCNGATPSKTTYADLFSAIGDNYKGTTAPPAGTFRLPSLAARVAIGVYDGYPLGSMGGQFTHTLTIPELPQHNHGVVDPGHSHSIAAGTAEGSGSLKINLDHVKNSEAFSTNGAYTGITTKLTGSGQPHNNMQPYTVVNYIIKY